MFSTFFKFELRFWLKAMMVYVFIFIIGAMFFGATASDQISIGTSGGDNIDRNAPYLILAFYSAAAILTCLMSAAFVNGAASRDFACDTHQLIFTKPIKKLPYLMGRFWGATLVSILPMLGVSIGVILAGFMWWIDKEQWGPIHWGAHLQGLLLFAVPNAIFVAAFVFAIAVWTRSTMAAFLGVLFLLVGLGVAESFTSDLSNEWLGALVDPFGGEAFGLQTKYWTASEKNGQLLSLSGIFLANRVLWLAISGVILAISCWRFSFTTRSRRTKSIRVTDAAPAVVSIPKVGYQHSFGSDLARLWSQVKVDFLETLKSPVFIVTMIGAAINMGFALYFSTTEGFGLSALPVTYMIVAIIRGSMYIFLVAMIVFYAGVLVWKERDAKLNDVYDALPQPTWVAFIGKLLSLTLIVASVLALSMLVGIATQALQGYTRFQIPLYLREFLVIDMTRMFCLIVLAMLVHVIAPNKYVGYFAFVGLLIANAFGWNALHVDTRMVRFSSLPGYIYSDMYQMAPFSETLWNFAIYWLLFAGVLCVLALLWWQRGRETTYLQRLSAFGNRWRTGWVLPASILACVLWGASAGWTYFNTQVKNEFTGSKEANKIRADYEKQFKAEHEGVAQPRVTEVKYEIDIFPERRGLELRGDQTIQNQSDEPMEQIFIGYDSDYDIDLEIESATLSEEFDDFDYQIYTLDPPLAPGQSLQMKYTVAYEADGFENSVSNTSIVQNGTFFNNGIAPQIGYQSGAELSSKRERKKHDLEEADTMPELEPDNIEARRNSYLTNSADWVNIETVISTSADQIAVAPGSLVDSWEKDGRRYFKYVMDHKSANFYSFISARYEVEAQTWNDIDIEIYYHPEHHWNVPNMARSVRKSLDYYTKNFGPYMHKQARIIEFPRVASFAQAFPGTMPYSEGIGFISDIDIGDDIDMVFYVVAHEMAHQWWAHQVIGADMQGATLLSETLAQYSALMVMEKEYGRDMMRKFLKYEMDQYLSSRGSENLKERPLYKVEAGQGYIHYRKGSVVMYYLKEMIGEEKVNAALRKLLKQFGYADPPYPTSVDLVNLLREQTPDEYQYLIADLFEEITLFNNRTVQATYQKIAAESAEASDGAETVEAVEGDGGKKERYLVKLDVFCEKLRADDQGVQTPIEINDWIEIGAFAKPEKGKEYGATLHRERVHITEAEQSFEFEVDGVPARVGIDPFMLLVDRIPDDNTKRPTLVEPAAE